MHSFLSYIENKVDIYSQMSSSDFLLINFATLGYIFPYLHLVWLHLTKILGMQRLNILLYFTLAYAM